MAPETPPKIPYVPNGPERRYSSPGRRELQKEIRERYRLITVDPNNYARRVKMGRRQERRKPLKLTDGKTLKRTGTGFLPVYGHAIEVDPPHKYMMMALRPMDRDRKATWFKNLMASAFVAFGEAIRERSQ